jgi:hypothetical protein
MTEWANYDIDGKRVPPNSERAAFRAKEVPVDTGVPAPLGHASLAGVEYRDVHAIDGPDLRKTFKSFSQMQRWFTEHSAGAKGAHAVTAAKGLRAIGSRRFPSVPEKGNRSACFGDKRGPVTRPGVPGVHGVRLGPGLRAYRPREPGYVRNRTPLTYCPAGAQAFCGA